MDATAELAEMEAEVEAEVDSLEHGELAFPTFADESHQTLPRQWNWADRLPRGKVVLVTGWRECGKGLVGWALTGALTTGRLLPGETGDPERVAAGLSPKEPAAVIGVWDEDDRNEDNSPRADAAGADRSRVYDMTELPGGTPFELSAAKGDMGNVPELLGFIRQLRTAGRNPRLVILDPLDNLVMNGSHMSKQGATRLIRRLEFVARRTGVTIVIFHHLVDDGKRGKVGGSSKLVDVPRWVYRIERDEEAPELWTLKKFKGNVGNPDPVRYRVVKDGENSRVEWVDAGDVQAEERSWRDLAPSQARILMRLGAAGPAGLSLDQLEERTGIGKPTLKVLLNKLKFRGLATNPQRGVWVRAEPGAPEAPLVPHESGYGMVATGRTS